MEFYFKKTLKKRIKERLIFYTICLVFLLINFAYIFSVWDGGREALIGLTIYGCFIGILLLIVRNSLVSLKQRSDGEWIIQITPQEVIWQTPKENGEHNFRFNILDISKIIRETSRSAEGTDRYYIETIDSKRIFLNHSKSGVKIDAFFDKLIKQGVKYETLTLK